MKFFEDGEKILSEWMPQNGYQGDHNVLHGGVQATLMDEIASWVVYVKLTTAGFTSRADVRYRKTVYVDHGPVKLTADASG